MAGDGNKGVDRRALLAGTVVAGASAVLADDAGKANAGESPKATKVAGSKKKPPIGPTVTWKQLEERTGLTASDGRKYHAALPESWENAEWVSQNLDTNPAPHFPKGYEQNQKLKQAIAKVFMEHKGIDPTDPNGSPWLLAWRMYPNAEHPLWKNGAMEVCGCNCGCFAPRTWA